MTGGVQIALREEEGRLCPDIRLPAPLPLARLVVGRGVEEVAALLPRLFNLCPMAQARAARLALGMEAGCDGIDEVRRERAVLLAQVLPRAAGLVPVPLADVMVADVMVPLPQDLDGFRDWCARDTAGAAMARHLGQAFAPGEAVAGVLPVPSPQAGRPEAAENSPAGRRAGHPLLRVVERVWGRGPLWRYLGLLADAQGLLPPDRVMQDGTAVVAAARGAYALWLGQAEGRVTGIARRTPTDDMLCPGGAVERALATLPVAKAHLAPLVIALHDPCVPVQVGEAACA